MRTKEPRRHEQRQRLLLLAAFLVLVAIYCFHFFADDGHSYVSPDGREYLAVMRGEFARTPINTRVLQPYIALALSRALHTEPVVGFHILTPLELAASVIIIFLLVRRRGGTTPWQIAILVAFGSGL